MKLNLKYVHDAKTTVGKKKKKEQTNHKLMRNKQRKNLFNYGVKKKNEEE